MSSLTFEELRLKNAQRSKRWHPGGITDWSPADWAVAMVGEAGECCNAVKKLNRIRDSMASKPDSSEDFKTHEQAVAGIGQEIADTVIYLDLLAQRLGLDLQIEVTKKFNRVSEKYGFPERL